jgi:hypothetical protein
MPRRALTISLATAALVVTGGVVVAAAVASSSDGTTKGTVLGPDGQPGPKDGRMRMAGPMRALHGEYVVSNGNGGYQTEEMQRGSVTAVNGGTFTVKSDDGYTHDWVTDSNTRYPGDRMRMMPKNNGTEVPAPTPDSATSTLTTGQTVMVFGTKDGDTFHAVRVMPMRQGGMQRDQNQNGKQEAGPQAGQQQNGPTKVPFGEGRGRFGHRFGGGMQSAPVPMPRDGTQSGPTQSDPTQSTPSPDQAPASAPTPTQPS